MKKILIIHTNYQNLGGEDIAVNNEVGLLEKYFDVRTVMFSNNKIFNFRQLSSFISSKNKESENLLNKVINEFQPDYAYVHNTWFAGSLSVFELLNKLDIPIILKLHNFRYYCTRTYFRSIHLDGKESCDACGMENKLNLFNKYFQDSYLKSLFVTIYGKKYFNILRENKIKLLVLTKFHKDFLSNLGINSKNIEILHNYLSTDNINENLKPDNSIIYAGRISKEKGVEELISAFLRANLLNFNLKIIGEGPLSLSLKKKYKEHNIKFLGELSNKEVLEEIKNAKAVITCTKLFENQPTLLCEASSLGVPSIFPRRGGIEEFFPKSYELMFEPDNYEDLIKKLKIVEQSEALKKIGSKNKEFIEKLISEKKVISNLENIFQ